MYEEKLERQTKIVGPMMGRSALAFIGSLPSDLRCRKYHSPVHHMLLYEREKRKKKPSAHAIEYLLDQLTELSILSYIT